MKAVNCKSIESVPCAFQLGYSAANWAGMKFSEFALVPEKASFAIESAFDKMGGWDAISPTWIQGVRWSKLEPLKVKMPGTDLPENSPHQIVEEQLMTVEDYDLVINEGLFALYREIAGRLGKQFEKETISDVYRSFSKINYYWQNEKKVPLFRGGIVKIPYNFFSASRSLTEFSKDLYRRPKKIIEASDAAIQESIEIGKLIGNLMNSKFIFLMGARASSTFLSEKMFKTFFFPYLKKAVKDLVQDGFIPRLHFGGDWTPFLNYFLELPKNKCILELETITNLSKAKDILTGHMCLRGGVPTSMFVTSSYNEVKKHCENVIDEVGKDGFILSAECEVPPEAKFETVQAMVDVAKNY